MMQYQIQATIVTMLLYQIQTTASEG